MEPRVSDILRPAARKLLCVRMLEAAAIGGIAGGVLASLALLAGILIGREATGLWGLLAVPAAAGLNALRVIFRGPKILDVARLLDVRCGLHEQLATAVELESTGETRPAAMHCCRQARQLARQLPRHLPLWSCTGRTAAALALSLLLAGAMAAVAVGRLERSSVDRFLAGLDGATQARRDALAERLREAGRQADSEASTHRLERAAELVELADDAELREVLRELEQQGYEMGELADAAASPAGGRGQGNGQSEEQRPAVGALKPEDREATPVYYPGGAEALAPASTVDVTRGTQEDFANAWQRVRRRVAVRPPAGRPPEEYRPMIRRFYAPAGAP
jgi:hypothetical protein